MTDSKPARRFSLARMLAWMFASGATPAKSLRKTAARSVPLTVLGMLALADAGSGWGTVVWMAPGAASVAAAVVVSLRVEDTQALRFAGWATRRADRAPRLWAAPAAVGVALTDTDRNRLAAAERTLGKTSLWCAGAALLIAFVAAGALLYGSGTNSSAVDALPWTAVWLVLAPGIVSASAAAEACARRSGCGAYVAEADDMCLLGHAHRGHHVSYCRAPNPDKASPRRFLPRLGGSCLRPQQHDGDHFFACSGHTKPSFWRSCSGTRRCALPVGHPNDCVDYCDIGSDSAELCLLPDGHSGDHSRTRQPAAA